MEEKDLIIMRKVEDESVRYKLVVKTWLQKLYVRTDVCEIMIEYFQTQNWREIEWNVEHQSALKTHSLLISC